MRNVMIGTPCYDGRVDCRFADSLVGTLKAAPAGLNICPVYMPNDALIQRSRNDLLKIAVETGVDDLVFIDSDQAWHPQQFLRLLSHQVDVVGGAVPKKTDSAELYNVRSTRFPVPVDPATGLLVVDGVGTGFLRLTKRALQAVWQASTEYENEGKVSRLAFDVRVVGGRLFGEDTLFCELLRSLGFAIHVDASITCAHVGTKVWGGDFAGYLARMR